MAHHKNRTVTNRVLQFMAHTPWYTFKGQARLASDAGVSKSAVSRLISGQSEPSFALVWLLTRALEKRLGKRIDPREIVSFDGTYPTASVCEIVGCSNCTPPLVYDSEAFDHVKLGQFRSSANGAPQREVL